MVSGLNARVEPVRSSGCNDCLGRIPYASLIASVLTCLGVGLFCLMFYKAFNSTLSEANKFSFLQHVDFSWSDKVQLTFTLVAVAMSVLALVLLIVGFFATGSTRDRVYSGWRARLGGRVACALLLILTYFCAIAWLIVFGITAVAFTAYLLFEQTCSLSMREHTSHCIDLGLMQPLFGGPVPAADWRLCPGGGDLMSFCQSTLNAVHQYGLALAGASAALIGFIHFLVCLAANYAHIKDGFKYFELDEVRCNEENELMATYGQHSVYRH